MDIFDLGNGDYEDELGFTFCPALGNDEPHKPLLRVVE